jgi:hypothetical protein
MRLFRSMIEAADGLPAVGPGARMLGVRPGNTPTPDVPVIHPQDVLAPGQGGMSVAPDDPMRLTRHRRPASLGGIGQDPVWVLEVDDLEPLLRFRQDNPTHGLIEPKAPMAFQDYLNALATLQARWRLYCR